MLDPRRYDFLLSNDTRVVFDDAPLAEQLLDRMRPTLPASSSGETAFLDAEKVITPATGTALLFQQHLLHEAHVVQSGVNYVLRTDAMYRSSSRRPG